MFNGKTPLVFSTLVASIFRNRSSFIIRSRRKAFNVRTAAELFRSFAFGPELVSVPALAISMTYWSGRDDVRSTANQPLRYAIVIPGMLKYKAGAHCF